MSVKYNLLKAKQVLNLSDDEFKGICLALENMKNKQDVIDLSKNQ